MASLEDFLGVHERLNELFSLHQELLLDRRLADAQRALAAHRSLMGLHMRHEERALLPIYAKLGPNPSWPVRLYVGQHRRMRELLDGAAERLASIDVGRARVKQEVISLLDYESKYKHLVLHHEDAERRGLFQALDFELDAEEQSRVLAPCLLEWRHAERVLFRDGAPRPLEVRAL